MWALVHGVIHPAGALLALLALLALACTEAVMVHVFVVIENRMILIRDQRGEGSREKAPKRILRAR